MRPGDQYRCLRATGGKQNVVWQDYLQPASQELHLDCTGKSPARDLVFQHLLLPLERFHFPVGVQQFTG